MRGSNEIRVKTRYKLSKKERRRFSQKVGGQIAAIIGSSDDVELVRVDIRGDACDVIIVGGLPVFMICGSREEPLLCGLVRLRQALGYPVVVVDRGATMALARGANLMLPGIREVSGDFDVGDTVVVVDEESSIPVAIGRAQLPSREVRESIGTGRKGVAVKITQRPGDRFWKICDMI